MMRILFFSNWSIKEGITKATVIPILEALALDGAVQEIVLVTVETVKSDFKGNAKIKFDPIIKDQRNLFGKGSDLVGSTLRICSLVKKYNINLLWCRGAPAGGIGALCNRLIGIRFIVDSFEPHSQYMLDSKTWSSSGAKYKVQKFLERLTINRAHLILPVSHQYKNVLLSSGVDPKKLFVFPCTVNLKTFAFDSAARDKTRKALGVTPQAIVGVYVGKFGGLYYDSEAFRLYRALFDFFGNEFFLLILTETDRDIVNDKLLTYGIRSEKVFVQRSQHQQIPEYLSGADFGISTIKSVPAMQFCSPIKHGEYWASDLPILSTLSFGDDAEIIRTEGGGVLLDMDGDWESAFIQLKKMIGLRTAGTNRRLAIKYRNPQIMDEAIEFVVRNVGYKSV